MSLGKKYEFTDTTIVHDGVTLHRIIAIRDFGNVEKGYLGGYIEAESNLSHEDNCWVGGNAMVYGDSEVVESAKVYDNAIVGENASISGYALVHGNAKVFGSSDVTDNAIIGDSAELNGNCFVGGAAFICDHAKLQGNSGVSGKAKVSGNAKVSGEAVIYDSALVTDSATVTGGRITGNAMIREYAVVNKESDYIVLKNNWSSCRYFTWTKSNNLWNVGCFRGTGKELIRKAFEDSYKKGMCYKAAVDFVETVNMLNELEEKEKETK